MAAKGALQLVDDDESDEFEIGSPTEKQERKKSKFQLSEEDEDSENLVPIFKASEEGEKILKRIAKQVVEDFDTAWESTEQYRMRQAENWKLFTGDLPLKHRPFKDAANIHVPSMLENTTRLLFRAFDELFGDWSSVFQVLPVGPDDYEKAEILTKHGNWQINNQFKDFYRQMMRAMLQFFSVGDVVGHSFYDHFRQTNAHEVLTCDDFVVPYQHVTTQPDYSDVPFKCKILRLYRHELQGMREIWEGVDKVIAREKPSLDDEPESLWAQSMAQVHKIEMPVDQRAAPYKLIWYEGWTDEIPNPDKKDRYIQAIVDYHSQVVLSVTIHEEANWQDKQRYERELQELQEYKGALDAHAQQQQQMAQQRDQFEQDVALNVQQGLPTDEAQNAMRRASLDPETLPKPVPPAWAMTQQEDEDGEIVDIEPDVDTLEPERPKKQPINTFVHGVCIEPIVGNLGVGFGSIQSDFNKAMNIMMSQMIDSATLANAWGIITAGNLEFERPFSHGPGMINIAKGVSGAQLKDSIFPLQPGQANPQMFDLLDRAWSFAQSSAQAPEVLSGEPGKSGETFRGLNARIEQATKQLSVPTRSFAITFFAPLMRNNALLNSLFLPDMEILFINNELGNSEELKVGRQMYERDYRVSFGSDLGFKSRAQKITEADEVVAMSSGMGEGDPMAMNMAFRQKALAKSLKARGQADMIPFLGPTIPPPQTPFGIPPPPPPPPPGTVPPPGAQPAAPVPAPGGATPPSPAQ